MSIPSHVAVILNMVCHVCTLQSNLYFTKENPEISDELYNILKLQDVQLFETHGYCDMLSLKLEFK